MALPVELERGLMPSLVDRLIDPESAGTAILIGYNETQMFHAVRRDVEELLNTRQTYLDIPAAFAQVRHSILTYGLPDLATLQAITIRQREAIAERIQKIVETFEPRLKNVRAHYVPGESRSERSIKYKIEASLAVDPAPEVAFETVLELSSGQYEVK